MSTTPRATRAAVVAVMFLGGMTLGAMPASALEFADIGMCSGRTDANVVVIAHANGQPHTPKYILNVSTGVTGSPTGTLLLAQGSDRLIVDQWCRVWQHLPGQPGGSCSEGASPEGSTNVHAVGIGQLADGTSVIVRTDVRASDDGVVFRVRYREPEEHGAHDEGTCDDGSACGDDGSSHDGGMGQPGGGHEPGDEHEDGESCGGGWTRTPAEGWLPLRQLTVSSASGGE